MGNTCETWSDKHVKALKGSVKALYPSHYPVHLDKEEIIKEILRVNKVIGDRGILGMQTKLSELYSNELFQAPSVNDMFFIIPEWFDFIDVESIKNYRKEMDKMQRAPRSFRSFLSDTIKSGKEHYESTISYKVYQNKVKVFSYPTIPYADYAVVFYLAFNVCGCDEEEQQRINDNRKDVETKNNERRMYWIGNQYRTICIKEGYNETEKKELRFSAYYLLDFLLGYLASSSVSIKRESGSDDKKKIKNALQLLKEKLDYKPNTEVVRSVYKRFKGGNKIADDVGILFYQTLVSVANKSTTEKIKIPEYEIYTPRIFELYTLALLKKINDSIQFKKEIAIKKDSGEIRGIPDYLDEEGGKVFDAKYMHQFRSTFYCDIVAANRMTKYLVIKKELSNGYFIYPEMKRCPRLNTIDAFVNYACVKLKEDLTKNDSNTIINKIGVPFPAKS